MGPMTALPTPAAAASGVPADAAELAVTLRELAWVIHRSAPDRAGTGPIPTTEIALLKQVVDTPGSTVGELAQVLGLRQPNVSAAVSGLAARGFVTRVKHPDDRRVTRIMPTEQGTAEHQAIADAWAAPLRDALATLDDEQRRLLAGASEALTVLQQRLRPS